KKGRMNAPMLNEKGSRTAAFWNCTLRLLLDRAGGAGETGAELFHAAGFDDAGLGAGVEGMRFRGDVALEERVGLAVDLGGFARIQRGTRDELVAGLQVEEHDLAVLGMNAFFHDGIRG